MISGLTECTLRGGFFPKGVGGPGCVDRASEMGVVNFAWGLLVSTPWGGSLVFEAFGFCDICCKGLHAFRMGHEVFEGQIWGPDRSNKTISLISICFTIEKKMLYGLRWGFIFRLHLAGLTVFRFGLLDSVEIEIEW
jgi:hypothetical protein